MDEEFMNDKNAQLAAEVGLQLWNEIKLIRYKNTDVTTCKACNSIDVTCLWVFLRVRSRVQKFPAWPTF